MAGPGYTLKSMFAVSLFACMAFVQYNGAVGFVSPAVRTDSFSAAAIQDVGACVVQRGTLRCAAKTYPSNAAYGSPVLWGCGMVAALAATQCAVHFKRLKLSPGMRQRRFVACKASDAEFDGFSSKVAFLFPGQGAQTVGMCQDIVKDCPAAMDLFKKASDIVGYDLLDKCVNGPKEELDTTAISQPAIFTASMAAVEKLKQDEGEAKIDEATVAMGLSLGEYSALCFAGAMSFEDGVKITAARGAAMQAASDAVDSGMVSVIGLDAETVEKLCAKASEDSGKKVQIANYLCKGNYTVSGDKEACAKLAEIAKPEFKARMAVSLAVAGAFHTDFMAPAVEKLQEVLASADIKKPRIPVVSNVDCKAHSDPEVIKEILAKQVTSPVMWETQMKNMIAAECETAYELGPGKVIAGIMKRIDKTVTVTGIQV